MDRNERLINGDPTMSLTPKELEINSSLDSREQVQEACVSEGVSSQSVATGNGLGDGYVINDAYKWLDSNRKCQGLAPCSEFGRLVATILTRSVAAIYNLPRRTYLKNWDADHGIAVNVYSSGLATFDFDYLTRLVIHCHDACVRLEIDNGGPYYTKLVFYPRKGRTGSMFDRHPTIEDAIVRARTGKYPVIAEDSRAGSKNSQSAEQTATQPASTNQEGVSPGAKQL